MKCGKTAGNKREVTIGTAHTDTVNSLNETNNQSINCVLGCVAMPSCGRLALTNSSKLGHWRRQHSVDTVDYLSNLSPYGLPMHNIKGRVFGVLLQASQSFQRRIAGSMHELI